MTQDEIIEIGTKSGLCYTSNGFIDWIDAGPSLHEMTLFAKLVAEAEREACAKVLDEMATQDKLSNYYAVAARAIRERGQA